MQLLKHSVYCKCSGATHVLRAFLDGWNIKQVWHPDGVHLSIVVFQPELLSSDSFDGNSQSYPINLVAPLNELDVAIKLVCAICHAV